jgi:hypothetical protein
MEFNCKDCPNKDTTFSPSIVVSIIDEFYGLVYGTYCNHECAANDTAKYFNNITSDSKDIVETVQQKEFVEAGQPKELKELKDLLLSFGGQDPDDSTPIIQADIKPEDWKTVFLAFMQGEYVDKSVQPYLVPSKLKDYTVQLNELWNDTTIQNSVKCCILAYWFSALDPYLNKDIDSWEELVKPQHLTTGSICTRPGYHPVIVAPCINDPLLGNGYMVVAWNEEGVKEEGIIYSNAITFNPSVFALSTNAIDNSYELI